MWHVDPDLALQSRLSFGRGARYAWAAVAGAVLFGFGGLSSDDTAPRGIAYAGAILLLGAVPYAAIQIRALERGGHFDARRLTGRSPVALGIALVAGSAWALALGAAVLLLAGLAAGFVFPLITLASLVMMGVAIALLILLLPASSHVDSWMLLILLALGVVLIVVIMGRDHGVALGTIVVSLLVYPWAMPLAIRRVRGSSAATPSTTRSLPGVASWIARTRWPELARLLSMGRTGLLIVIPAMAATPLLMRWVLNGDERLRELLALLVVYGPLLVAAHEAGSLARHELGAGGLERIRLTDQRHWSVVLQIAVAAALPFVLPSLTGAAALVALDPRLAARALRWWPMMAGMWIFAGLAEGLRGRKPGVYQAVFVLMGGVLTVAGSQDPRLAVAAALIAGAIAIGSVAGSDAPPLRGPAAVIAAALLSPIFIVVLLGGPMGLNLAGALSLTAGFFVADRRPRRASLLGPCALAVALSSATVMWQWFAPWELAFGFRGEHATYPTTRGPVTFMEVVPLPPATYPLLVAVYAGLGLTYGWLAQHHYWSRPRMALAIRAAPAATAFALTAISHQAFLVNERFLEATGYNLFGFAETLGALLLAAATFVVHRRGRPPVIATQPQS